MSYKLKIKFVFNFFSALTVTFFIPSDNWGCCYLSLLVCICSILIFGFLVRLMCRLWDISLICAAWEGGRKNCYGHKMVHLVTPNMYSLLLLAFLKLCVRNSFHSVRSSTGERLSTPFWCFEAPASSSHPPARNPLCTHRTGMASARHREGEISRQWRHIFNSDTILLHLHKHLNYQCSTGYSRSLAVQLLSFVK